MRPKKKKNINILLRGQSLGREKGGVGAILYNNQKNLENRLTVGFGGASRYSTFSVLEFNTVVLCGIMFRSLMDVS